MERHVAIELLRELVSIRSLSRHEHDATAWLAAAMRGAGYERAFVDEAGNAVGEMGDVRAARTFVLLGHIDTVPGDIRVRYETTPEGDVLYGRGSVDAKGPLATFVSAVARLGPAFARQAGVRLVVVGAVEEEAASSKGARFIAARFDGGNEPIPDACVIGEPSSWRRVTLGYKGRLLLDIGARQPMAHTAGPDASVASVVVDVWNWARKHADACNDGREKAFDQVSPSLRAFNTSAHPDMHDRVAAQIAWRLPVGFDPDAFVADLLAWTAAHLGAPVPPAPVFGGAPVQLAGTLTEMEMRFHAFEPPWRGDRQNALVRAFLAGMRRVDPSVQPGFVLKTGTSDMNVVAPAWGCPTVAYGPGDSALDHTPHEHVHVDEYWRAVLVLEQTIRALAQV